MRIVMLGTIGTGKSTQSKILAARYGIPHISTGDIFREHVRNKTELGLRIQEECNEGGLMSDEITNEIVKGRILEKDCEKGFILDGYPRTGPQAEMLDLTVQIHKVVFLELEDRIITERVSGRRVCPECKATYHIKEKPPKINGICDSCLTTLISRDEDNPDAVLKRLSLFHRVTEPLVDYYRKKNVLLRVDASGTIEEVADLVFKALVFKGIEGK